MSNQLTNISPIDGRYKKQVEELGDFFSEAALMKYRVQVEISYLIALAQEKRIKEIKNFDSNTKKKLNSLWQGFDIRDAQRIKKIEKVTDHDVKAVEYFIKEKIKNLIRPSANWSEADNKEFIHFALTSEDINNLAYTLQIKEAIEKVYLPVLKQLLGELKNLAKKNKSIGLLSMTHGQPATPTTLGKEMAVFYFRLKNQLEKLEKHKFSGKLNGASGCFAAHKVAYPDVDWVKFSKSFVESLGLAFNPLTTQIESHDSLVEVLDNIRRINNIVIDFDQDIWLYVSRGLFLQERKKGEIGSSTMPHKINPWYFENSEGNLSIANAYIQVLADKLPISRLQRDLRDSTLIRNQGMVIAHSVFAYKKTLAGLNKLVIDKQAIKKELAEHPEVLAEAVQVILRKVGYPKPYEKLKEMTRGRRVDIKSIRKFIEDLDIDEGEKKRLLKLNAENYTGLASELVESFV